MASDLKNNFLVVSKESIKKRRMKNTLRTCLFAFVAFAFASCAGADDNGSDSDPLIGKWNIVSQTTNGNPKIMTPCDLMQTNEFHSGGINLLTTYQSQNGDCVPQLSAVTRKWLFITSHNYQLKTYDDGKLVNTLYFQATFSEDHNTITTFCTNEYGETEVATFNRDTTGK